MTQLGIETEVCEGRERALALLANRKFDPVILDCEGMEGASELLQGVRQTFPNRDSIALGIISQEVNMRDAFQMGANLVLRKPVDGDEAHRILRTAHALVTRLRRHFLRQAVGTLAYVTVEGMEEQLIMLDLCEGGMALQAHEPMQLKRLLRMRFQLPETETVLAATGEVTWADISGRAGIRFVRLPDSVRQPLREWLGSTAAARMAHNPLQPRVEDERERFTAPLRLKPAVDFILSAVLDGLVVLASVVLFGIVFVLASQTFPAPDKVLGMGLGLMLLHGVLYRYFFFGRLNTPGVALAKMIESAYLEFVYQRQVEQVAAIEQPQ